MLGAHQPEKLEYLCTDDIEMTFYPNGVRLYGRHGAGPRADRRERDSDARAPVHVGGRAEARETDPGAVGPEEGEPRRLDPDVQAVARELAEHAARISRLEILYRELLQVVVASPGASRLIQAALEDEATAREPTEGRIGDRPRRRPPPAGRSEGPPVRRRTPPQGGRRRQLEADRAAGRPDAAPLREPLRPRRQSRSRVPTCWSNPGRIALMKAFSSRPPRTAKKLESGSPTGPSMGTFVAT